MTRLRSIARRSRREIDSLLHDRSRGLKHVCAIAAGTMPEADQSLERARVFVRFLSTNAVED